MTAGIEGAMTRLRNHNAAVAMNVWHTSPYAYAGDGLGNPWETDDGARLADYRTAFDGLLDDTPVDEAWFRAVGGTEKPRAGFRYLTIGPLECVEFAVGTVVILDHPQGLAELHTRGQVRAVCLGLRIPLAEG